jgi:hypothetical protein
MGIRVPRSERVRMEGKADSVEELGSVVKEVEAAAATEVIGEDDDIYTGKNGKRAVWGVLFSLSLSAVDSCEWVYLGPRLKTDRTPKDIIYAVDMYYGPGRVVAGYMHRRRRVRQWTKFFRLI